MEKQNDILDELRSWGSPLADMPRAMPFAVPEGYFSGLEHSMKNLLSGEEVKLPLTKEMPFTVPQGYFETLPDKVLSLAKGEAALPKVLPFETPAGYFEQLPAQMLQAAKEADKKKTRVIPLNGQVGKSIRWAAAAILLLALGFGSYRMLNPAATTSAQQELAALPADVISEYVRQNIDEFDMEMLENSMVSAYTMPSLSDEDIIEYLDETGGYDAIN